MQSHNKWYQLKLVAILKLCEFVVEMPVISDPFWAMSRHGHIFEDTVADSQCHCTASKQCRGSLLKHGLIFRLNSFLAGLIALAPLCTKLLVFYFASINVIINTAALLSESSWFVGSVWLSQYALLACVY